MIPYNDKSTEFFYIKYCERMQVHQDIKIGYNMMCDIARDVIISNIMINNMYEQFYTLKQINHIAQKLADAYRMNQKTVYKV